jgi:hypothetical protein
MCSIQGDRCSTGFGRILTELKVVVEGEQSPVVRNVARFGLPCVILIFYLSASLGFEYTPDSTFHALSVARGIVQGTFLQSASLIKESGTPSPLWDFMIAIGGYMHLDLVLASKILSLFFSCGVILCSYFVAFEVLRDHLLAFCTSLIVAMQSWLLQIGPSGSALSLGLLLSLACLFFLLRNEYILAAFFCGVCTLVFWQAIGLAFCLVLDVFMNSIDKHRSLKIMAGTVLVYLCVLLPWVLFAYCFSVPGVPRLWPVDGLFVRYLSSPLEEVLLLGMMVAGFAVLIKSGARGYHALRSQIAPLGWVLWLSVIAITTQAEVWLMVIPLFAIYAFAGLRELLFALQRQYLVYGLAFVVTGLLLVYNQIAFRTITKDVMRRGAEESRQLVSIAYWLKANGKTEETIASEQCGILGFFTDNPVVQYGDQIYPGVMFVVTTKNNLAGYRMVYSASASPPEILGLAEKGFALWRKE